jgi:hypothetical protein
MNMRLTLLGLALVSSSIVSVAQEWEIGGGGGYGWSLNSSVTDGVNSVRSGQAPRPAFSVFVAENEYNYIGGECQYVFRSGGTQLKSPGIVETASGYSNILVYNLTVYMTHRESRIRPFVAAGAGIKIYTNSSRFVPQPLAGTALLLQGTEVKPAVSFDGGVKYMLPRHVQLRLDFRAYASPTPDDLIRPVAAARIKGWLFDLMPMVGVAYVF